ncbi:MAG: hypothetical protein JXR37_31335 [Kiritimatiellae bacterium]|nr:hypothetical protein [Kiritimatiellia bacterium]
MTKREARNQATGDGSRRRHALAVGIGFVGAVFVWVVSPYQNTLLGDMELGDSYMSIYAMFVVLLLVLAVNPALRLLRAGLALDHKQLGVILGMMLIAAVVPRYGCLAPMMTGIPSVAVEVREKAWLADAYAKMNLPSGLFPDKLGYGVETPAIDYLLTELPPGMSIPWQAWLPPLLHWGTLLLFIWLMMIGLGYIVFPQWRQNERLAFPLLTVFQEVTRDPAEGRRLPPLFRQRVFWITAGVVFVLHFLQGASAYNPERVPAIPLQWNLSGLFTEDPWRHFPRYIYESRLYFAFVGIAFFMPNRISFSIWFFAVAYAVYQMVCAMYFPGSVNVYASVNDHRMGAMCMLAVFIVWLGRAHWAHVFRCLVRRARRDEDVRDRTAAFLFLTGCAGIWGWLVWAGMQPHWAFTLLLFGFVVALVITRIVAETGVPFVRSYCDHFTLLALAPTHLISTASIFLSCAGGLFFSIASRVCPTTMAVHAQGLQEDAPPSRQRSFAVVLIVTLLAGLVIGGAARLHMLYRHSTSLDDQAEALTDWSNVLTRRSSAAIQEKMAGQLTRPTYGRVGHTLFGAGLAGGLQWACLAMPRWPLHPVGILMAYISYGRRTWSSVFLGWVIKLLLVRYGGSRLYHAARPVFLGLILGEVFATVFWGIAPVALLLLGHPYKIVHVLPF